MVTSAGGGGAEATGTELGMNGLLTTGVGGMEGAGGEGVHVGVCARGRGGMVGKTAEGKTGAVACMEGLGRASDAV